MSIYISFLLSHIGNRQDTEEDAEEPALTDMESNFTSAANILDSRLFLAVTWIIIVLLSYIQVLKGRIVFLVKEKYKLAIQVKGLNEKETLVNRLLRSDKKVIFYTGLPNKETIYCPTLHDIVQKFVLRRWRVVKASRKLQRIFKGSPRKFGPSRKLSSKDEFLLSLMRLWQGTNIEYLADAFGTSKGLAGQIFQEWITAMDKVLCQTLLFWPSLEQVHASKSRRYRAVPRLRAVIDFSEIFY